MKTSSGQISVGGHLGLMDASFLDPKGHTGENQENLCKLPLVWEERTTCPSLGKMGLDSPTKKCGGMGAKEYQSLFQRNGI